MEPDVSVGDHRGFVVGDIVSASFVALRGRTTLRLIRAQSERLVRWTGRWMM